MFGSSRISLGRLQDSLEGLRADEAFAGLPAELRAVSDLLETQKSLRLALSDSGRSTQTRVEIAQSLLASRVSPLAMSVVDAAVRERWSEPADLVQALTTAADTSAFMAAQDLGVLDQMGAEMFAVEQILAGSAVLQAMMTNPAVEPAKKSAIVAEILAGKVHAATAEMLAFSLSHLRGRRSDEVLAQLQELAADQRNRQIAEIRVARPLTSDQIGKMTDRLRQSQGKDIRVNVVVDPTVLGGVHVTMGGEVIDGTIATRLDNARRVMTG